MFLLKSVKLNFVSFLHLQSQIQETVLLNTSMCLTAAVNRVEQLNNILVNTHTHTHTDTHTQTHTPRLSDVISEHLHLSPLSHSSSSLCFPFLFPVCPSVPASGTTTRLDLMDEALWRPGGLEVKMEVGETRTTKQEDSSSIFIYSLVYVHVYFVWLGILSLGFKVFHQVRSFKFNTTRQHTQIRCSHTHTDTHTHKAADIIGWWWTTDKGPYTCLVTFHFTPLSLLLSVWPFCSEGARCLLTHNRLHTVCDTSCNGVH